MTAPIAVHEVDASMGPLSEWRFRLSKFSCKPYAGF